MEVKPLSDTLALVLAKALVNKLFNSLAVVKIKKTQLHWVLGEDQEPGRNSSGPGEEKFETLSGTLAKVEANLPIVDAKRWSIQWQVH